jgi:16S rRNA (guanine527-N7)-methyltransferase
MGVLLLRATEYGNRGWFGADARAGRDADHPPGRPKGRSKEHFSLSETDARAARLSLERALPAHGLGLPPGFADAAERFVALLLEANRRLNLTRVVEPEPVARLHLLDSLAALPILDAIGPRRALDLGSGGGVPGLVLALARPEVAWSLVDSVRKKADAMRSFVVALALPNVEVLAERAEIMGRDPSRRESYDLVTARACAALPVLVEYALPLTAVGGALLAWKGRLSDAELGAGRDAALVLGGGTPEVRSTGFAELDDHRFVVVPKSRPTPAGYPRRAGEPSRRPLA